MEYPNQREWLDKAILRTVPGTPAEPDFAQWRNKHAHALDTLKLRAQQKTRSSDALASTIEFGRRIMESKYTKIAVAAALIIGLFFLAQHLVGSQVTSEQPAPTMVADQNDPEPQERQSIAIHQPTLLEKELELAKTLFSQSDVEGLIALLQTGQDKTKATIAGYLGEIGDDSVIPVLQKLADTWHGSEADNPFQKAIDGVVSRKPTDTPEQNEPNQHVQMPTEADSPWAFQPQGVLSGTITDAITGAPIVGAEVEIWWHPNRAYTNKHGFYTFDKIKRNGNWQVRIHSKAYLVGGWQVIPLKKTEQAVKHFEFKPGCMINVDVVDEQGHPVDQVTVAAAWLGSEHDRVDLCEDQTNPNGQVSIGALEPSDTEYRLIARHNAYAPEQLTLRLNDLNSVKQAEIVLKKGVDTPGYAEYADGVPAQGLGIIAKPDWWQSNKSMKRSPVDAEGVFTLQHIVPGMYNIYVSIPDDNNPRASTSFVIDQKQLPVPRGEIVTVRIPRKSPQSLASISGRIVWASDQRPQNLTISVINRGTNVHRPISIHEKEWMDTFMISSLEPDTYTLRFEGVNIRNRTVANVQAPCHDLEVTLEYTDKPRVVGQVIYGDTQQSVTGFKARVLKLKTLDGPNYVQKDTWTPCSDGFFDIEVVGPGIYQVHIQKDGYASSLSQEINTNEDAFVTVELTKGGSLKGRVVTTDGSAVSNATLIPLSAARGNMPRTLQTFVSQQGAVKSQQNGEFIIEHLPPGRETLRVTHADHTFAIINDIEILDGQMTKDVEICLSTGGNVEGIVFDGQGRPEANVTLFFQDAIGYGGSGDEEAGRLAVAVTDANGCYAVSGLPTNKVCYVKRKNWNSLGTVQRSFIPMEGKMIQLDFGGPLRITGAIVVDGLPMVNIKVILVYPGQSHFSSFYNAAITNKLGEFCFQGIPKGRYAVYYQKPGRRTQWACAKTSVLSIENVDLGTIPEKLANIEVSLVGEGLRQGPWTVYLQEGATTFWKARMGQAKATSSDKTSYLIEHVLPGTHQVVASRKDMKIRMPLEVTASDPSQKVILPIPSGSCSISGMVSSSKDQPLLLWNTEKTITVHISPPGEPYRIDRLPAGHYMIGNYFVAELAPLAEFSLADGEHKTIDLNTDNWPTDIGHLVVHVINDTGIILSHADTWLEGASGRVEPLSSNVSFRQACKI